MKSNWMCNTLIKPLRTVHNMHFIPQRKHSMLPIGRQTHKCYVVKLLFFIVSHTEHVQLQANCMSKMQKFWLNMAAWMLTSDLCRLMNKN